MGNKSGVPLDDLTLTVLRHDGTVYDFAILTSSGNFRVLCIRDIARRHYMRSFGTLSDEQVKLVEQMVYGENAVPKRIPVYVAVPHHGTSCVACVQRARVEKLGKKSPSDRARRRALQNKLRTTSATLHKMISN